MAPSAFRRTCINAHLGSSRKTARPVNGAGEIMGVWKPAVNGGPRRCAKNPVNGVRRVGNVISVGMECCEEASWATGCAVNGVRRGLAQRLTAPASVDRDTGPWAAISATCRGRSRFAREGRRCLWGGHDFNLVSNIVGFHQSAVNACHHCNISNQTVSLLANALENAIAHGKAQTPFEIGNVTSFNVYAHRGAVAEG